jgi:type IV pilus assembly protein PilQ
VTKVPLLGDIPVLGVLFRKTDKRDEKRELLVFVTPRILKESLNLK